MEQNLSKILNEKTNAKIIWFLRSSKAKYSDILRILNERDSGKVNYHLKKLIAESLIKKEDNNYYLTKKGVKYALYVDSLQLKEKYPLPVVLVAIVKNNKILLGKRCREPCNNQWGLPGNEILYGESPYDSAKKEIKTEIGFDIADTELYGVYPTTYREEGELIFHVMLFAVKAKTGKIPKSGLAKGKIKEYKLFSKKQLEKLDIIPSNKQPIFDAFSKKNMIKIQDID
ncbi:MAG: NUDIX domain-containing protein, partial [Nanoarchaeota archaeon]|nr:NUDIX domain-containing protein [Nanoarchaeota archaeon]